MVKIKLLKCTKLKNFKIGKYRVVNNIEHLYFHNTKLV